MSNEKILIEQYAAFIGQFNKETLSHSKKVAKICKSIAKERGLDEELAFKIGLLHDLGKIYIPSRILKKSSKLSSLEREIIDLHSYYGYKILLEAGEPPEVYMPVLFHHGLLKPKLCYVAEEMNEDMLKYVFLVHSVDIYEAMSAKRIYHEPKTKEEIFNVLENDWMCTPGLLKLIKEHDKKISE